MHNAQVPKFSRSSSLSARAIEEDDRKVRPEINGENSVECNVFNNQKIKGTVGCAQERLKCSQYTNIDDFK